MTAPHLLGLQAGDRALVVAAHPDDESLGMAGTIAAMSGAGIHVDILAVTCAAVPPHGGRASSEVRHAEFGDACEVLGATGMIAWADDARAANPGAFPAELVRLIEDALARTAPAALFIPAGGHHQDHDAVHRAGLAAVRPGSRAGRPLPRIVLGFDGPEDRAWRNASVERPVLVDITSTFPAKLKALLCYGSQLQQDPHPRSLEKIQALDQAAGAACGAYAAEMFALYRMLA